MDTLHIRIDKNIKTKAGKTLADLGMDMTTAVKVFLHQVIVDEGLPFTPNRNVAALKARLDHTTSEAIKKGKSYKSAKEMHAAI
jgi:DNA-damage-inducible protein J